jgi:Lon protease-like protein
VKLAIFPLHTVLFPGMALPLQIFEPRYLQMIGECLTRSQPFGVVLIDSGREVGGPAVPHPVGTVARITSVERQGDGRLHIEAVGQQRFRLLQLQYDHAYLTGRIEEFPLAGAKDQPARQSARALVPWLARYLHLLGEAAEAQLHQQDLPHDPAGVGYLAAIVAQIPMLEKQALLATSTATELLQRERAIYRREISLLRAMLSSDRARAATPFSPN